MDETEKFDPGIVVNSHRPWWWRIMGLRRRERRWWPIGLTAWGWVFVVLLVVVGGGVGFGEYSMQPDFCRSCHIMEPYYQAWQR